MSISRDDFEYWLFDMDNVLEEFLKDLPDEVSHRLDYSIDSLTVIESWILAKYASISEIIKEPEAQNLDRLARYVGETFRKNLGGIWDIDLENEKSAYYHRPVLESEGRWTICPVTKVTACTDRRTGVHLAGILKSILARYGGTDEAV